MGVGKEGTKNGVGYVGGLFQLFDWTSKSRKKLFAAKSDLPESSKQDKKVDGILVDEDEIEVGESIRGSNDHSYASSVTDDEVCGTRVPSVVARLMGLDSLPPSSFLEPYSTPYFDTRSFQDAQYLRKNLSYQRGHQIVYSGNLLEKDVSSSKNLMEPKPKKTLSKPIEKFQTEVLPPKSAKSIPVTHHKLLSPIKSPGFVPANDAAYIMEAAARIIEPEPQATAKAKTPVISSSTVSLKVRDLKEKVEAARRGSLIGSSSMTSRARDIKEKREVSHRTTRLSEPSRRSVESNAARYLKGQSLNKSWNGSVDTSIRSSTDTEEDSSLRTKGKSVSLAIQAKVNVQRREGFSSNGGGNLLGQKEHHEVKPKQPIKTNVQKSLHKKSSGQNTSVLRQNNQKQNCSIDWDKLPSKPLVSNSHGRKILSGDSPYGRHRSSNSKSIAKSRVGSRKSGLEETDSEKEVLYASTINFPRKKRSTDRNWNDRVVDNLFVNKTQKSVQSNLVSNDYCSWAEEVKKKDTDVVSFTFTTPLTKNNLGFETSRQVDRKSNALSLNHCINRVLLDSDSTRLPVGYNVIGGDALGILLEQKLKELTNVVETSSHGSSKARPPSSVASNSDISSLNSVKLMPRVKQKNDQDVLFTEKSCSRHDPDIFSRGVSVVTSKHKPWVIDEMEESRSDHVEARLQNCWHPSPISVLEPTFSTESCESSVSTDATNSTEGSKLFSSVQAQEVLRLNSRKFYPAEADAELLDSASSTLTRTMLTKRTSTFSTMKIELSSTWELDYVKEILCNVELMYMDFALGQARQIVNPHLFNQLEILKGGFVSDGIEYRMRRKVLFDCVSECLDSRCRRYVGGGYKIWAKGVAMVRRNEGLAEEVHKEISAWGGMGDSMVDELVDKDMSRQYGRWLDFDVDAFELGAEVEDQILNSLVDDVVAEILRL